MAAKRSSDERGEMLISANGSSRFWFGWILLTLKLSYRWRLILLVSYWAIGFLLTHVPLQQDGVSVPYGDKIAHFVLYAGLCFLLAVFLGRRSGARPDLESGNDQWNNRRSTLWAVSIGFAICCFYGGIDEGLQLFIPSRTASWYDWFADLFGALFGALLYWALREKEG